jgi:hypothetical protein
MDGHGRALEGAHEGDDGDRVRGGGEDGRCRKGGNRILININLQNKQVYRAENY